MMKFIKNFRKDEDGAVTVDWVVLTAAVVGLAVAAYSTISDGANDLTSDTAAYLERQDPTAFADIDASGSTSTSGGSTTGGSTTGGSTTGGSTTTTGG